MVAYEGKRNNNNWIHFLFAEFLTLTDGSCEDYLALRRNEKENGETAEPKETTELKEMTEPEETTEPKETTEREDTTEPEDTPKSEETTEPDETTQPEEKTEPDETTQPEEKNEPEEDKDHVDSENNSTETTTDTDNTILHNQVATVTPEPAVKNENVDYENNNTEKTTSTEFTQPPGEEYAEDPGAYVLSSPLDWSFCGAYKYLQFARFAESASSMAHYGWLRGNDRYSHIINK
ncbi:unnamed protein product [Arctia plantaginis]|uniref:Uncharacterized protein n=1 Tax=Arctia plantaginis TaxID=874455 RepID=A0A8S1BHU3_ARCPL|nr:unnamed protein product [Arctia plantaginis]